jgi:hypothetical protein
MESTFTDRELAPTVGTRPAVGWDSPVGQEVPADDRLIEHPLPDELLADLDDPDLVLSPGYIGTDRRDRRRWARVRRATFSPRRSLLRLELAVVAVVAVVVVASLATVGLRGHPSAAVAADQPQHHVSTHVHTNDPAAAAAAATAAAAAPTPTTTPTPSTTPAPASTVPAPAVVPATTTPAPATTAPAPAATAPPLTPDQMGAQALALVRYPWQSIPGYSIQFLPIADAPSPGFYGNTTFTWGQAGGTSVLYVYPGETVDRLAGITAFEIGHEVDAAAVEPQGGETQIENILGIHPASWAPDCDCAEQGFLSGWYSAAFSNYWSPGVGNWSQIAPEPSGATLTAVEPWLNPTIP